MLYDLLFSERREKGFSDFFTSPLLCVVSCADCTILAYCLIVVIAFFGNLI